MRGWGAWWVWCLSGVLVGVSEWSYGCGRVVYVVWRRGDFSGRVRGLVCVVCRGWLVGYGDRGEERRGLRVLFRVWCGV